MRLRNVVLVIVVICGFGVFVNASDNVNVHDAGDFNYTCSWGDSYCKGRYTRSRCPGGGVCGEVSYNERDTWRATCKCKVSRPEPTSSPPTSVWHHDANSLPQQILTLATKFRPVQVASGWMDTCAIDNKRGMKCWGSYSSYGNTNIPKLMNPVQISIGFTHACAIDEGGVKCWGEDSYGDCDDVPELKNPIQVSAGLDHTCALDREGVKCWGESNDWDSDYNYQRYYNGQRDVPELKCPIQISAGAWHTCALDMEGVKCWGAKNSFFEGVDFGQANVPKLKNPVQVSAGTYHTCAIDAEGVKCWGDNEYGQTDVPTLKNPVRVSAGFKHTCAIDAEGVKCWGDNKNGQTDVPSLYDPIQVSAGVSHTCAIDKNGVKCWGNNEHGQTDVLDTIYVTVFADVETLPQSYREVSNTVYSYKQRFLLALSKMTENASSLGKQFTLAAMDPVLRNTDSDIVAGGVLPAYENLCKENQIHGLEGFGLTDETEKLSIGMIQAGLSACRDYLTSDKDRKSFESIQLALGKAFAGTSNIKELLIVLKANESVIENLKSGDRTIGFGLMIGSLVEYLEANVK